MLPLHGIGGRQDLPVPLELAVGGAAVAITLSFVILGLAWRSPKYRGAAAGRALPAAVTRTIDAGWFRWAVRGFGLALFGYAGVALLFGADRLTNPIFGFFYILVWVGLVPLSLLLGPVWRTLNPLRTLHLLACRLLRQDPARGLFTLSPRVGVWPAAGGILAFAWLELVAPDLATLVVVQSWLALYVVLIGFGAVLFGQAWFAAADPFEAYATLMAKLSVWGRRDGAIVVRRPLENLDSRLQLHVLDRVGAELRVLDDAVGPAALVAFVLFVLITYSSATILAGRMSGSSRAALPGLFAHSVVPIVLGYVVAHYFTLLWLEGQRTVILLSDPLSNGANVFGTGLLGVNDDIVNFTGLIASIQVGAVVIGHLLGVVSAHDRAVALFPRARALVGQIPLLIVMVAYTTGGLLLLFSQ
ncbi:hypothetical protein GCM10009789_38040 [Kribbella sancticallisti]|uniref:Fenitrothion hydrolase n=1 Tax=Kribbella sancticallisti TaxID=460087 RepID=A0ABP4PJD7_9ACTN